MVECLGSDERRGSVTAIGAVSPSGRRHLRACLPGHHAHRQGVLGAGLLPGLRQALPRPSTGSRPTPLYVDTLKPWYEKEFGAKYMQNRDKAMHILQEEAELQEIVRLVGQDALSPNDRLTMETAKMIREDFLQQNAFIDEDAYSSLFERSSACWTWSSSTTPSAAPLLPPART